MFPKYCIFCGTWRITIEHKIFTPYKLATFSAEHKIREAAEITNDNELIVKISTVDLIAEELMMHNQCYLDYVCLEIDTVEDDAEATNNFLIVRDFIQEAIVEGNKAVSL